MSAYPVKIADSALPGSSEALSRFHVFHINHPRVSEMHLHPHRGRNIKSETDEALLMYMGMHAKDPSGARVAWAEFYQRHRQYVLGVCRCACAGLPAPAETAMDLCSATFLRVYLSAHTFKPLDNVNAEYIRRRVRAWIGTIARNLLTDWERRNVAVLVGDQEVEQLAVAEPETGSASPQMRLLKRALSEVLTDKERLVILQYFQWYEVGKEHQRLPKGVAERIAKSIDSTPINVRQIRSRALKKIKSYIERTTTCAEED